MKLRVYRKRTQWCLWLAAALLVTANIACEATPNEQLPTETQVPTTTIPPTPTAAPTPTYTPVPTPTMTPVQLDHAALLSLYQSTNGDEWTNNSRWLSDLPLDQWHGVTIDDLGRVTEIRLVKNNLSGDFPTSITDLDQLVYLNLRGNNLTGGLPRNLQRLSRLEIFDVSDNMLSGPVPVELAAISSLKEVHFTDNGFTGLLPMPFFSAGIKTIAMDGHLNPYKANCTCPTDGESQKLTQDRVDSQDPSELDPSIKWSSERLLDWSLGGAATIDPRESILLTPAENEQIGYAYHPKPMSFGTLAVRFAFQIGNGTGADGLGLVLVPAFPDNRTAALVKDAWGEAMGAPLFDRGVGIYFDTWKNPWDIGDNIVSVNDLRGTRPSPLHQRHLLPSLSDGGVYVAEIYVVGHHIDVYLSNPHLHLERTLVLSFEAPGIIPALGYLGFVATTGGANDLHIIHDVQLAEGWMPKP